MRLTLASILREQHDSAPALAHCEASLHYYRACDHAGRIGRAAMLASSVSEEYSEKFGLNFREANWSLTRAIGLPRPWQGQTTTGVRPTQSGGRAAALARVDYAPARSRGCRCALGLGSPRAI